MKFRSISVAILSLTIVIACVCEVSAQRKLISLEDYSKATLPVSSKSREMTRRVVGTEETIMDGVVTKTVETIIEAVIPGGTRSYVKTTEGDKITESERIYVNNVWYFRNDGGAWNKEGDDPLRRMEIGGGLSSPGCLQYSVDSVFFNGRQTQMFEALSVSTKANELVFNQSRMWVDVDGLPYREEHTLGKMAPRIETYRSVSVYEYDPKIKIEAPIK